MGPNLLKFLEEKKMSTTQLLAQVMIFWLGTKYYIDWDQQLTNYHSFNSKTSSHGIQPFFPALSTLSAYLQMSYWTLVKSSESKTEVYESLDNPERILL